MSGLTFQQHEALRRLNSNIVSIIGTVATDKDNKIITYDLDAVNKEVKSKEYQEKRQAEYPTIANQLDMIYHAGQGGDNFQKAIKAVKDKYSKE